ncbi:MAG: L-2-hydroxyglutarate oxidase [Gammaproteobacteria bacterium]|nr:L-2-hydroxyglutarate oxidase [Gammaproteobacteria bacterium]
MVDFSIIGGGIVGLSTAWQLKSRHPDASVMLIEKEIAVARHQTGRNSGVIHAGIYYEPGSMKARFCKAGVDATIGFCREHGIAYEQCGKLIVATNPLEQERLLALYERAQLNGLDVEFWSAEGLRDAEPNICGTGAIYVRTTGIVDYALISRMMAELFEREGGELRLGTEVTGLADKEDHVAIRLSDEETIESRYVVVCAGLMADRLTRMQGLDVDFRIVPYRGEYYQLPADKNDIVGHLIYPVPDPALPFLGVHLTRMIDGSVTVGPNALQGWKREGYGGFNFSLRDTWEQLTYAGFWRVTWRFLGIGLMELKSAVWKPAYLRLVQKYCPAIALDDLQPHPVGVRATAVSRDGTLIHDFLFAESARSLHVCNAPSPAATSAIPIGNYICEKLEEKIANA